MDMIQVSDTMKQLRDDRDYTQTQVAEFLGISQQAYSNYERNVRELPSRLIPGLSKLYNVSPGYILGTDADCQGFYNLNSPYIQNITLRDMLSNLTRLNMENRHAALRFISYLINAQNRVKR